MNYISPQETADKWHVSKRSVQLYCAEGKIPGAKRIGNRWIIPENAVQPSDGRVKGSQSSADLEPYHFPLFVASRFYTAMSELNPEERQLLEAQKLNLGGRYVESVEISRRLIAESTNPIMHFGAYYTNAANFLLLGLPVELSLCMKAMERLCELNQVHSEDLQLLLEHRRFNNTAARDAYENINITKLSPDALTAYSVFVLYRSIFASEPLTRTSIQSFTSVCRNYELMGISPVVLAMHGILANHCSRNGDTEGQLRHIEAACQIGHECGFDRLLGKYTVSAPSVYHSCLCKYGHTYADRIEHISMMDVQNVNKSFRFQFGYDMLDDAKDDIAYSLLLSYDMTIPQIAIVKGVSEQEVRSVIRKLCEINNVQTKTELVAHYHKLFYENTPNGKDPPCSSL